MHEELIIKAHQVDALLLSLLINQHLQQLINHLQRLVVGHFIIRVHQLENLYHHQYINQILVQHIDQGNKLP